MTSENNRIIFSSTFVKYFKLLVSFDPKVYDDFLVQNLTKDFLIDAFMDMSTNKIVKNDILPDSYPFLLSNSQIKEIKKCEHDNNYKIFSIKVLNSYIDILKIDDYIGLKILGIADKLIKSFDYEDGHFKADLQNGIVRLSDEFIYKSNENTIVRTEDGIFISHRENVHLVDLSTKKIMTMKACDAIKLTNNSSYTKIFSINDTKNIHNYILSNSSVDYKDICNFTNLQEVENHIISKFEYV